jgi:hypothetical protein
MNGGRSFSFQLTVLPLGSLVIAQAPASNFNTEMEAGKSPGGVGVFID